MGARFSASVQTGPGAYPASCTMGTGSFPRVKRPKRGADHPPPSKFRGHKRVELYLYSPSGPQVACYRASLYLYLYCVKQGTGVKVFSKCLPVFLENATYIKGRVCVKMCRSLNTSNKHHGALNLFRGLSRQFTAIYANFH